MKKTFQSIKLYGIFILLEILIAFIIGLFNLMGINISLSKIIILLTNVSIFFTYGLNKGKNTNKKGLLQGLITGGILILILFIISLIFFHNKFTISTLLYYIALLFMTLIGSTIGKNKKKDSTLSEKK